ncbi:ATP-binding protein [Saccharopolyspora erythraea]|uniref:ATP-binding protein n=1 Tax=Saccharopolyspora erythraea TaxID=1836 RepID=UPI0001D30BD6|nr:tetratricopeptide repeat protein [Saccharopolyspora erythraea]EQD87639.1 regulatory protein [Saccharopolyspora erythraea D]QRK91681.1 tetratricopeptide repeat protein [Saccharopolyspora erythraea]
MTTLLNGTGSDHTVLVSTIDGLAGVGKSTLVVQWAHQVRERFPDGELYVNLRGFDPAAEPMTPGEALGGFITALGVAPEAVPLAEDARAAQFRTLLHGRRMLVVLDNARNAEQVLPLLPASPGCLVVVTSRQRLDGLVAHHGAQRLALETLTRDEGRRLLARYLGGERLEHEPEAVEALLHHCAGLPLALTLVAVQADAEPDVPLEDLAIDLRSERDRLDALDAGGETGIRAVFSWSYRSLSPQAARLFRLLGLPNSPDISAGAAAAVAGTDHRGVRRLLAELCRAHLLTRRAGDRYVFHDLLRAYARERAHADDSAQERTAAFQRLLDHYLYTTYAANHRLEPTRPLPELDHVDEYLWRDFATYEQALGWWDAEHANVLSVIRQAVALRLPRGPWLAHAATFPFKLRGLVEEMEVSSADGVAGAQGSGDRPLQARLLSDLSTAYLFRGEFDASIRCRQSAAELFAELGEHQWEALMHAVLGETFLEMERYADAAASAREALRMQGSAHGKVIDPGGADAVLGLALAHLGEFSEAFPPLHRAFAVADQFGQGYALTNLGSAHFLAGDMENAVRTYHQAVQHRRDIGHESAKPYASPSSAKPCEPRVAWRRHGTPGSRHSPSSTGSGIRTPRTSANTSTRSTPRNHDQARSGMLEATRRPELRELLTPASATIREMAADRLGAAGVTDSADRARDFVAFLDGLLLEQITGSGGRELDDAALRATIRRMLTAVMS